MGYVDISELDDKVQFVTTTWKKTVNYAATFANEFLVIEEQFKSGRYGPEWTFSRWLGVKCGISRRTTYRIIEQLHRVASDDQRERVRRALEDERRQAAQRITDRRATQIAWDGWRAEEKQRAEDVQTAWDGWLAEEKQRKEAERQAKVGKRKKAAKKKKDKARYKRKKAEKNSDIKAKAIPPLSGTENEKAVPDVALIEAAVDGLVAALNQLPLADRLACLERIVARLEAILNCQTNSGNIVTIHPRLAASDR